MNHLEDRMVEITATEQNIEKRMKNEKMRIAYDTSGTTLNAPIFTL